MLWLGGTDSAQEGVFSWTDETTWTYQNWALGEPNNKGVFLSVINGEDCMAIDLRNGTVNG